MLANHPIYGGDWHPYKKTLVPHLVATLIYLSQIDSYYIRGDRSPLSDWVVHFPVNISPDPMSFYWWVRASIKTTTACVCWLRVICGVGEFGGQGKIL